MFRECRTIHVLLYVYYTADSVRTMLQSLCVLILCSTCISMYAYFIIYIPLYVYLGTVSAKIKNRPQY